jgi:IS30 family transposase
MHHLTQEQRYIISSSLQSGKSRAEICVLIGRDKSVLSREIARNRNEKTKEYSADLAQRKYATRQKGKRKACHFTASIQSYVEEKIESQLSPEQIVGIAKRDKVACVSHERIYQHVWDNKKKGGKLHKHLRTKGKKYRKRGALKDKRGIIPNRVPISERPQVVEQRERIGDLEIDTIIGQNHQGAIVTINDRATGMLKMKKLNGKDAGELSEKVIETLQAWQPFLKTITSDNGKEFAQHERIAKELGIDFFFAQPYHSWQRGSNENLNGLIRQYIPKKTDFNTISDEYVQFVENQLNNRPRKRFDFLAPIHMFNLKVAFTT